VPKRSGERLPRQHLALVAGGAMHDGGRHLRASGARGSGGGRPLPGSGKGPPGAAGLRGGGVRAPASGSRALSPRVVPGTVIPCAVLSFEAAQSVRGASPTEAALLLEDARPAERWRPWQSGRAATEPALQARQRPRRRAAGRRPASRRYATPPAASSAAGAAAAGWRLAPGLLCQRRKPTSSGVCK